MADATESLGTWRISRSREEEKGFLGGVSGWAESQVLIEKDKSVLQCGSHGEQEEMRLTGVNRTEHVLPRTC